MFSIWLPDKGQDIKTNVIKDTKMWKEKWLVMADTIKSQRRILSDTTNGKWKTLYILKQ